MKGLIRLGQVDDIAEGQSRGFDPGAIGQDTVVVVKRHGRLHGWRDACPHFGDTPMAWRKDAYLSADGTRIVCAAHGAQFDVETGVCTLGPCLGQALESVAVIVVANDFYIQETRP